MRDIGNRTAKILHKSLRRVQQVANITPLTRLKARFRCHYYQYHTPNGAFEIERTILLSSELKYSTYI